MNNTSKIITGLVTGIAIGSILGILFAPDKGAEIRKKIRDKAKKISADIKNEYEKGKETLEHLKEESMLSITEKPVNSL